VWLFGCRIWHGVRQGYGLLPDEASWYCSLSTCKLYTYVPRAWSEKVDLLFVQNVAQQRHHRFLHCVSKNISDIFNCIL